MASRCCEERRMAALFLAGSYDTSVRSLVKPKVEEQTCLCFPLRNSAGISGSFSLSVSTSVIFLVTRIFVSPQLVKKFSVVTPLPFPYM